MNGDSETECFWDFSVRTYRVDGVANACLSLQDEYGADVNMVLFCCWVGGSIGYFDQALFDRARAYSNEWVEHVIKPIRSARTWMKHTGCHGDAIPLEECMQLREQIKTTEFAAEKMQEEVLESFTTTGTPKIDLTEMPGAIVGNLQQYAHAARIPLVDEVAHYFSVIITAAYPHLSRTISVQIIRTPGFAHGDK